MSDVPMEHLAVEETRPIVVIQGTSEFHWLIADVELLCA